jgi:hypothetical protein
VGTPSLVPAAVVQPTPTADPLLCGPENPEATEAPREAIVIGQRMPLSWRLCYMWRAIERDSYFPTRFVTIRIAYLVGYPAGAHSPEVSGPGDGITEVTIARIEAISAGNDQLVQKELQIQYDGDYIDFRNDAVIDQFPPRAGAPPSISFDQAYADARNRGLLPAR